VYNQKSWFTNPKARLGIILFVATEISQVEAFVRTTLSPKKNCHGMSEYAAYNVLMSHQEKRNETLVAYFHPLLLLSFHSHSLYFASAARHQQAIVDGRISHAHTFGVGVLV
jgi:hypothetical protein